ncbi:glycosyltransferase, partial [bacterium]|nr:glycosyltransferase [bacterium]
ETSFLIVGGGPLENKIQKVINKNKIQNQIFITGMIKPKEVLKYYSISDIILFPSIWEEPFSGVLLESAAMEKPVIASNNGCNSDIIINKKTGFLLDPFKFKDLDGKIKLLIKNKKLRIKMGKEAKRKAKKKYDSKIIIKKVEKIYLDLI